MLGLFHSCVFFFLYIKLPKIPDNSPRNLTSLTSLDTQTPLFDLRKKNQKSTQPCWFFSIKQFPG